MLPFPRPAVLLALLLPASAVSFLAVPETAHAQAIVTTIPGPTSAPVRVNTLTHKVYIANEEPSLAVVEGATQVATIPLPSSPLRIELDKTRNRLYVPLRDGSISVIDGNTGSGSNFRAGTDLFLVVSERTGRAYGAAAVNGGAGIPTQIIGLDGTGNRFVIDVPWEVCSFALNDRTNQLFVLHCTSHEVSVVDLDAGSLTRIQYTGSAVALEVIPATNRAYVVNFRGGVAYMDVIDGATKTLQSFALPGVNGNGSSASLTFNPANNRLYLKLQEQVAVIDPATVGVVSTIRAPEWVSEMRADGNNMRALAGQSRILTIDGATGAASYSPLDFETYTLDVDPTNHRIYVAGGVTALLDGNLPPGPPRYDYQGLWWNSPAGSESGWGLDIAQQGDLWFAAWFTYDQNGDPTWFVMPRGERTSGEAFAGTLYQTTGPDFNAAFDASRVTASAVGTLSLRFSDPNSGTMEAVVNGTRVAKAITRQIFASPVPVCKPYPIVSNSNATDIWWSAPAGSESGWGLFLTQQGENVFSVWFTYANGKPVWFVGSNIVKVAAESTVTPRTRNVYRGTLYRTSGPPFAASPWSSARVTATPTGSMSFGIDVNSGEADFSWAIGGLSGRKNLARQAFSTIRSACYVPRS
jgi:hypothetical protein